MDDNHLRCLPTKHKCPKKEFGSSWHVQFDLHHMCDNRYEIYIEPTQ